MTLFDFVCANRQPLLAVRLDAWDWIYQSDLRTLLNCCLSRNARMRNCEIVEAEWLPAGNRWDEYYPGQAGWIVTIHVNE